ncbi:MAG: Hsp70 family protein [Corynebacterium sp.]|nr:Hsp70 family protein [Corynebacterium sp.]
MNNPWHLAIDFGTSNSAAAHTAPLSGSVETLPLSHRSNLVPSAGYVKEDGTIVYGDSALSMGRRNPSRMVVSPKRYIGHELVQLAGEDVSLKSLISAVYRGVLDKGRAQHAGEPPETITITHPESWSVHNVDTLIAAALDVGVPKDALRTITEPRAAAMHYAARQKIPPGSHVAVFDFGGGTLDIAVLRAEHNGDFKVIAAKGDNSLGGRTIDNLLYRWVIDQVEKDDPDLADELRMAQVSIMHSLDQSIREAKEMLSDTSSATITVSTPHGEQDFLITRDEFNEVIHGVVARAVELTQSALRQAGVDGHTPIYMTGGSSRIPYVQNRLGEIGMVMTLDDPKTVVARGALEATMLGFTVGSGNVVAPKPNRPNNPFGVGPGTAAAAGVMQGGQPQTPQPPQTQVPQGVPQGMNQQQVRQQRPMNQQFANQPQAVVRQQPRQPIVAPPPPVMKKKNRTLWTTGKIILAVIFIPSLIITLLILNAIFKAAGSSSSSESTVTTVNATAPDSAIPLKERYSTADQFLPTKLVSMMQECTGAADEYSDDLTVPVYTCGLTNDADVPRMDSNVPTSMYWIPRDNAQTARDELESGKATKADTSEITKMQIQASGPEIGSAFPKYGSGFVYIYYPDDKFTLYFKLYGKPGEQEIKDYLKYVGVMI